MKHAMKVEPNGDVVGLYQEALDMKPIGDVSITRASHVEPNQHGQWFADMSPCKGPVLGPFNTRSQALEAEVQWLLSYLMIT